MDDDRSQAIAARAYELWERSGRPRGQHEAHWRQAEEEICGTSPVRRDAEPRAGTAAVPPNGAGGAPSQRVKPEPL